MNGGARPGAGRPKGSANRHTVELREVAERNWRSVLSSDLSPVDVMLMRMRGETVSQLQFEAAVAVAPYVCPRLSAVAVQNYSVGPKIDHSELVSRLGDRIAKLASPTTTTTTLDEQAETQPNNSGLNYL